MVVGDGTLRLVADQERAVRQPDQRTHAVEARHDGREPDVAQALEDPAYRLPDEFLGALASKDSPSFLIENLGSMLE
jgi:hypothetical protein